MFAQLSLQSRLILLLCILLLITQTLGLASIALLSRAQLVDEYSELASGARQFASVLNKAVAMGADPAAVFDHLATELQPPWRVEKTSDKPADQKLPDSAAAPIWFWNWIGAPTLRERFPITVGGSDIGHVVFAPDLSADVREKWIALLIVAALGGWLILASALVAYHTVKRSVRPLQSIEAAVTDLRNGRYEISVASGGPPEFRSLRTGIKGLSNDLVMLRTDNRHLLRRLVSIQDEERRDLARELHDELGPQLFAIRAAASALQGDDASHHTELRQLAEAAEELQKSNRRILESLRPMLIQELGLTKGLQGLIAAANSRTADVKFTGQFASHLDEVDPLVARTIYRVLQEALTNVMRHARATQATADVRIDGSVLTLSVTDNGIGLSADHRDGRGITGMRERLRALGGSLHIDRTDGSTVLKTAVPLDVVA